jgi:Flp pilus assembly protein TadG
MAAQSSALRDGHFWGRVRHERGETLVEFALGLTLFLTILFGTIQFGLAVWQYNVISNLAQEGARWASVHGKNAGSPANRAAVEAFVRSRAVGMTGVTVDTYSADATTKACTTTPTNPNVLTAGDGICVWVQKPATSFTALIPFASGAKLGATAQMIMAR